MSAFEAEVSDARNIAESLSWRPDGFKFERERQDVGLPDGAYVERYRVLVTCNGKTVEYQGGRALDWLALFESDVRDGRFRIATR